MRPCARTGTQKRDCLPAENNAIPKGAKYIWRTVMARPSKTNKRKVVQAAKASVAPKGARPSATRRTVIATLAWVALGVGTIGAGGAWAVSSYNQSQEERDLTRIGKGQPAVVQIRDPQCSICNALQREARKALTQLDGEPPIYLVADITQPEGAIFAQLHTVQHVTLLVFDAQGNRVETLVGSRTRDELAPVFARYVR